MARKSNGRKSAERDGSGRFAKGNPGGPGRPPGSPNRRSLAGRQLLKALEAGDPEAKLPSAFDRMAALLNDPDPRVRLGAERTVLGLLHGRPAGPEADEDGTGRLDPDAVALRLANFVAAAVAKEGPIGADATESPRPDDAEDPPAA